MRKRKAARPTMNPASLTDGLRAAILRELQSGRTLTDLERSSGARRASMLRFLRGERDLRLAVADRIAAALGLRIVADDSEERG